MKWHEKEAVFGLKRRGFWAKLAIFCTVLCALLPLVASYEKCGEQVYVGENCTMVTPLINCTVMDYDIYNASRQLIVNDAELNPLNGSIYYFNWTITEKAGNYLVMLCDGTTKEVDVVYGSEDKMVAALFIILPLIFGALLMAGAFLLKKEDKYSVFKTLLFITSFAMILPSLGFAFASQHLFFPDGTFSSPLTNFLFGAIFIIGITLSFIVFFFVLKILEIMAKRKERYGGGG